MFRKAAVAAVVTLAGLALAAPAGATVAPVPVCLITTSFGKETICAELLSRDQARATFHTTASSTLTVTLEYQPLASKGPGFVVLASKRVTGSGLLSIDTDPATVPDLGSVQACATAVESPQGKQFHLCASR